MKALALAVALSFSALAPVGAQDALQLSGKLGIAGKVPQNADAVVALYDLGDVVSRFKKSILWGQVKDLVEQAGGGLDLEADGVPPEILDAAEALFSDDVALILGEGSADTLRRLLQFSVINSKLTYKTMGAAGLGGGLDLGSDNPLAGADNNTLGEVAALLDRLVVPRVTLLCAVDNAPAIHRDLPPPPEEDGLTVSKFTNAAGHEVHAATFDFGPLLGAETRRLILEEMPEESQEGMNAVLEAAAKVKFTLSYGPVDAGHYAFTFGPDARQEKLAPAPGESVLALPETGFAAQWAAKNIFNFSYASADLLAAAQSGHPLSPLLESLSEVLADTPGLEAVAAKLAPRLNALVEDGDKLMEAGRITPQVGVGFWEQGYKQEVQGGIEPSGYDLKTPLRMAAPKDAFLVFQNRSLAEKNARKWKYFEDVIGTLYEGGMAFAEMQGGADNPDVAQGMAMAKMVGPSLKNVYAKLREAFTEGLGEEGMFVLDFGGGMPQVPDVPPGILEKGKVPRIALAFPVKDRAVLAQKWKEIPPIANELFESMGAPMRVPDTLSSDAGGLSTHFFPLPFLSDDVLPSTSVSDQTFILGTSKNLAREVAEGAGKADHGAGVRAHVNFAPLKDYLLLWKGIAVQEGMFPGGGEEEAVLDVVYGWLGALRHLDGRIWLEQDKLRSSYHIDFTDVPAGN